jgi:hypothetical protein
LPVSLGNPASQLGQLAPVDLAGKERLEILAEFFAREYFGTLDVHRTKREALA